MQRIAGWVWVVLLGCDHGSHTGHSPEFPLPSVIQVDPSPGPFSAPPAADLDPDPAVVEVEVEARPAEVELAPGRRVALWSYNGQLPGPRIEARVGDRVRVRLKNALPEATTIHWHGLRVPNDMDGVAPLVPPGGEQTYEFTVPDAGTFWYHPHVRSDEQVERGLYGAFIVRGRDEPATATEHTIVLDDIYLTEDGTLAAFDDMLAMPGRQGNLLLTNGRARPILDLPRGGLHRLRFINAANARYFRLALPGRRFTQIGTDGGLLEAPATVSELLLVPGERADVILTTEGEPGTHDWQALRYERGHGTGALPDADLFQVRLDEGAQDSTPPLPTRLGTVEPLPVPTVERTLELEESMGGGAHAQHGSHAGATFSINGQTFPDVEALVAELGAVEAWTVRNTTEMDHPFHLHGFRFQIKEIEGQPVGVRAWRDTINIPAQQTVVFHTELADHPGTWMFHCHILEHAERGMVGLLQVGEGTPENPHAGHGQ